MVWFESPVPWSMVEEKRFRYSREAIRERRSRHVSTVEREAGWGFGLKGWGEFQPFHQISEDVSFEKRTKCSLARLGDGSQHKLEREKK
jgi:hypothetical protein